MNRNVIITLVALINLIFISHLGLSKDYQVYGFVESIRKGNIITILFKKAPFQSKYVILHNNLPVGFIEIISIAENKNSRYAYRTIAQYGFTGSNGHDVIRAGTEIALLKSKEKFVRDFSGPKYVEKMMYRTAKRSDIDDREMILIPEGDFMMGSDNGDPDERPVRKVFVKGFYLDKYEVSNSDYRKFVNATNSPAPLSWEGGRFPEKCPTCPVLVTYHEALAYAGWSKKRLPSEKEWEKAASAKNNANTRAKNLYPWGDSFSSDRLNSRELWLNEKYIKMLRKKDPLLDFGLMPVTSFSKRGASFYGVVNMAGNASEWTSSWYMPYEGNYDHNKRYGKQYKVIRGGAWFDTKYKTRTTNRELGGIPSLYTDNIAGFRCAQDITMYDIKTAK